MAGYRAMPLTAIICIHFLSRLDLEYNYISMFDDIRSLASLAALKTLNLKGNPVSEYVMHSAEVGDGLSTVVRLLAGVMQLGAKRESPIVGAAKTVPLRPVCLSVGGRWGVASPFRLYSVARSVAAALYKCKSLHKGQGDHYSLPAATAHSTAGFRTRNLAH